MSHDWGEKQVFKNDARVAAIMAKEFDVELVETDLGDRHLMIGAVSC